MAEEEKKFLSEDKIVLNVNTDNHKRKTYFQIGLTAFITVVCCILFFFFIFRFDGFATGWNKLISAAQPIIIGLVIAYLLNPVMKFWEKTFEKFLAKKIKDPKKLKKTGRGLSVTFAIIILFLIIAFLIATIVPSLITSISSLVDTLPGQVQSLIITIENGDFGNSQIAEYVSIALTRLADYVENWAKNDLLPEIQTYVTQITTGVFNVLRFVMNFVIGIIVAVYVMMIQETLQGQSKKIIYAVFSPKVGNEIIHTIRKSSELFGGFITGKLLDSLIIGIICYIGCLIMRIPNSMLVSVIIGVTNVIPFFGPFIGAVPTLLLVVIQSPWHALYLLIFILVLQQVDGNIIGPKIIGNTTGLSSFWVMFAILVFGGIWGFFGMLLGVPIMAVIYYIVGRLVRGALRKKKLPDLTEDYVLARGINLEDNTIRYTKPDEVTAEKEQEKKES